MNAADGNVSLDHALALLRTGKMAEARAILEVLAASHPNDPAIALTLGTILIQDQPADALAQFRIVAHCAPQLAVVHLNMGLCLRALGRLAEALAAFRIALDLQPGDGACLFNTIKTMVDLGDLDGAITLHREAAPHLADPQYLPSLAVALLPEVAESADALHRARAAYEDAIANLGNPRGRVALPALLEVTGQFFAGYQGYPSRDQQRRIADYYASLCPDLTFEAPKPARTGRRLRLGFASANFYNHTIGKLMRGLIAHLDRSQFEVFVFTTRAPSDARGREIADSCDTFIALPHDIAAARVKIADAALDVLVYPDIGMEAFFYFLAFARLAPLQCVMWGHPVTTGIPAIDHFISARDLECDDAARAQDLYSERLVRLGTQPTYLYPPLVGTPDMCPDLSFAQGRTIYACVQHPLKFHPDFDRVLADILRRDPNGVLILLDLYPHLTERLLARLARAGIDVPARIHVLPRLEPGAFFEMLKASHVVLDTIHFSGGISSAEALGLGKIVVTWPHPDQMPGRVTYAYYRQMSLDLGVARDLDDYVDLAVRFGTDGTARENAERAIRERASRLFRDEKVLRDFEAFFRDACLDT